MDSDWDSEVERRLEALKCYICGGTNPYVCKCAKAAWIAQKTESPNKKPKQNERFIQ